MIPRKPDMPAVIKRVFLEAVRLERRLVPGFEAYPFCIPAVRHLRRLAFHPAVTFFIGENGSGKSTLLEAVAVKLGFNAEGGSRNLNFATRPTHSVLHRFLRLERGIARPSDGYFLRAESLYNVATELEKLDEVPGGPRPLDAYGGESLHAKSHGEAFLALLLHRLRGNGIYLFDEPEAALSPQRQLAVLSLIPRLVRQRSQLIIATHSPILLAYPHARIYLFAEGGLSEVKYAETEHYYVTRDFLNRHERMLEMLLAPEDETPTPEDPDE